MKKLDEEKELYFSNKIFWFIFSLFYSSQQQKHQQLSLSFLSFSLSVKYSA